jgi:hypothetical protein
MSNTVPSPAFIDVVQSTYCRNCRVNGGPKALGENHV